MWLIETDETIAQLTLRAERGGHESPSLYSESVLPTETLLSEACLTGPQGRAAFVSSAWDDATEEEIEQFLADAGVRLPS